MQQITSNQTDFVRSTLLYDIYKQLGQGQSIKLVGIPSIGVSVLMKQIHLQCTLEEGSGKDYCSFFINNRYNEQSFLYDINTQLSALGMTSFQPSNQKLLIKEVANFIHKEVKGKFPKKKLLFIFDDFQKNFEKYKPNNTILDEYNLTDMKDIIDKRDNVFFIVNYLHPLDTELYDDWYLNNLYRIDVKLFTSEEVNKLISTKIFKKCGKVEQVITEDIVKILMYFGGYHPAIIEKLASSWNFENFIKTPGQPASYFNDRTLIEPTKHFFIQICNSLRKEENNLRLDDGYFIEKFRQIADGNYDRESKFNEFIQAYCCESSEGATEKLSLFSEYFAKWIKVYNIKELIEEYNEKMPTLSMLIETKKRLESRIRKFNLGLQATIMTIALILLYILYLVFSKFEFDKIDPALTFISMFITPVASYFLIKFSFRDMIETIKEKYKQNIYVKNKYNEESLEQYVREMDQLKLQLQEEKVQFNQKGEAVIT